jgi:demethylmenaquinone methyltransferase/2-methoxy-6-polyprenyl-1,4-benzoquinol methylase
LAELPTRGDRARYVRQMFGAVARRYDFLNHLLSAGLDRRWRARAAAACAEAVGGSPAAPPAVILDLCCGTGDLALAVLGRCLKARVIACDFSPPMLERAARKFARVACGGRAALVEADALALPLPDASVDAVTCGFGLRNLADAAAGLAEMLRVLRPGGPAVILEFHSPRGRGPLAGALGLYFRRILPRLGAWISGGGHGGYSYLVASIEAFGPPEATARAMAQAGLTAVRTEPLAGGIASVYVGLKPA